MPIKILVSDDSATMRQAFAWCFLKTDTECRTVPTGNEAFQEALIDPPDVIFADVGMTGDNGYELCRKVRNDPKLTHIPVVLLTPKVAAEGRGLDGDRAREVASDGELQKPFDSKQLLELAAAMAALGQERKRVASIPAPVFVAEPEILAPFAPDIFPEAVIPAERPTAAGEEPPVFEFEPVSPARETFEVPAPALPGGAEHDTTLMAAPNWEQEPTQLAAPPTVTAGGPGITEAIPVWAQRDAAELEPAAEPPRAEFAFPDEELFSLDAQELQARVPPPEDAGDGAPLEALIGLQQEPIQEMEVVSADLTHVGAPPARPVADSAVTSPITEAGRMLEQMALHELVEQVIWDSVPALVEAGLNEKYTTLIRETVEQVVWEVVPPLAESLIKARLDELAGQNPRPNK